MTSKSFLPKRAYPESAQHRTNDQRAPSDSVSASREEQRYDLVADERQGQQYAGLRSDANEIEDEHDG